MLDVLQRGVVGEILDHLNGLGLGCAHVRKVGELGSGFNSRFLEHVITCTLILSDKSPDKN
jgi:hypothetical protein